VQLLRAHNVYHELIVFPTTPTSRCCTSAISTRSPARGVHQPLPEARRGAHDGERTLTTARAFWLTLFAIGAAVVLATGVTNGQPWTAAAFVVFFVSRVARSEIKQRRVRRRTDDAVGRANQFILITAAGWLASGALAIVAALAGEGWSGCSSHPSSSPSAPSTCTSPRADLASTCRSGGRRSHRFDLELSHVQLASGFNCRCTGSALYRFASTLPGRGHVLPREQHPRRLDILAGIRIEIDSRLGHQLIGGGRRRALALGAVSTNVFAAAPGCRQPEIVSAD
jgi:hypothetical protein